MIGKNVGKRARIVGRSLFGNTPEYYINSIKGRTLVTPAIRRQLINNITKTRPTFRGNYANSGKITFKQFINYLNKNRTGGNPRNLRNIKRAVITAYNEKLKRKNNKIKTNMNTARRERLNGVTELLNPNELIDYLGLLNQRSGKSNTGSFGATKLHESKGKPGAREFINMINEDLGGGGNKTRRRFPMNTQHGIRMNLLLALENRQKRLKKYTEKQKIEQKARNKAKFKNKYNFENQAALIFNKQSIANSQQKRNKAFGVIRKYGKAKLNRRQAARAAESKLKANAEAKVKANAEAARAAVRLSNEDRKAMIAKARSNLANPTKRVKPRKVNNGTAENAAAVRPTTPIRNNGRAGNAPLGLANNGRAGNAGGEAPRPTALGRAPPTQANANRAIGELRRAARQPTTLV